MRSPCRWGWCPHGSILPSSPSPRGQYLVPWANLPTQSGLLSSCRGWCWWGRSARALSRSGLLVRVPEVGALCLAGESTKAGRDGAGLPQGQANPVNPVLSTQPFSPFPPQCCSTLVFNWSSPCGYLSEESQELGHITFGL